MNYDLIVSIVTYNSNLSDVLNLSNSLESIKKLKIKTIIADNFSNNDYYQSLLLESKSIVVSIGNNSGYGKANNFVDRISPQSKYFLVLNPDIKITPDNIYQLYEFMENNNNYALIGPILKSKENKYYNIFRDNFDFFYMFKRWFFKIDDTLHEQDFKKQIDNYSNIIDVKYISGSFMFFRREIYSKLGGFNNKFFMYFEDIEICDYIRKCNYDIGLLKTVQVEHLRNRGSYKKISLFIHHFTSWAVYKFFKRF